MAESVWLVCERLNPYLGLASLDYDVGSDCIVAADSCTKHRVSVGFAEINDKGIAPALAAALRELLAARAPSGPKVETPAPREARTRFPAGSTVLVTDDPGLSPNALEWWRSQEFRRLRSGGGY